uniref:Odorant receptor 26 n=1 Tax=Subpsaltria yangi TaxID=1195109 RepID=A0A385IUT4_9HEMI|nr:odorant receptor 26 [Subpsaltria yangi]
MVGGYPGLSFHENKKFCLFFMKYVFSVVACVMMCMLIVTIIYSMAVVTEFSEFMELFYGGTVQVMATIKTVYFYIKRDQIRECLEVFKLNYLKCMSHNPNTNQQLYINGINECNFISSAWEYVLKTSVVLWVLRPIAYYLNDLYFNSSDYAWIV